MERKYKIALIILGAVLLAGILGIVINQLTKPDDQSEDEAPLDEKRSLDDSEIDNTDLNQGGGLGILVPDDSTMMKPKFNVEQELSNSFSQVKDQVLYPKRARIGGLDYSNVRTSPEVNTDKGWWDTGNLITTISSGTPIGRVKSIEFKLYNGYNYKWFKVKLIKPTGGVFSPYTEGYVRADTVTFKPYKK